MSIFRLSRLKLGLLALVLPLVIVFAAPVTVHAAGTTCDPAPGGSFLGFPTWYEYLGGFQADGATTCNPSLSKDSAGKLDLTGIWLIGLALVDMVLRLSGILAIGMVIYGGIRFTISQGQPDATKAARGTIINALVGLVITIIGAATVRFLGNLLS